MSTIKMIASVPLDGFPERRTLEDVKTVYELEGWRDVFVAAAAVAFAVDEDTGNVELMWKAEVFADDDLNPTVSRPTPRRLTVREGWLAVSGGVVVGFLLGLGAMLVAGLGILATMVAGWLGGWSSLTLWSAALGAAVALVLAVADPERVRP